MATGIQLNLGDVAFLVPRYAHDLTLYHTHPLAADTIDWHLFEDEDGLPARERAHRAQRHSIWLASRLSVPSVRDVAGSLGEGCVLGRPAQGIASPYGVFWFLPKPTASIEAMVRSYASAELPDCERFSSVQQAAFGAAQHAAAVLRPYATVRFTPMFEVR